MRFYLIILLSLVLSVNCVQAQCPADTPGIIFNAGITVLNYNDSTPSPVVFSQVPAGLPNTEYVVSMLDSPASSGNGAAIVAVLDSAVFLPSDFGLSTGDSFSITPVSYDLQQIQSIVDTLLNGLALPFPPISCCAGVQAFLSINICDTLAVYGINSGSDVVDLSTSFTLIQQLFGGGGNSGSLSVDDLVSGLQAANNQAGTLPITTCGVNRFPICFSVEPDSAAVYFIDCLDTTKIGPYTRDTICAGALYVVVNDTYHLSGFYNDTIRTLVGCDSVISLDLAVLDTFRSLLYDTLCADELSSFGSNSLNSTGIYYDTFAGSNGCDSIAELWLEVKPLALDTLNSSLCIGDSLLVGSSTYKVSGNYTDTFAAFNGCDSIVFLQLQVLGQTPINLIDSICPGDSFQLGSVVYKTAGIYSDTLLSSLGCDSAVQLDLRIRQLATRMLADTVCPGQNYVFGGTSLGISGTYFDTSIGYNLCDSVTRLDLLVLNPVSTTLTDTICGGSVYAVGVSLYDSSGTYTDTLSGFFSCDSVVVLDLLVLPADSISLNDTICEGDTFAVGSSSYTASGIYSNVLSSVYGCDSLVRLDLQVLPNVLNSLTDTICAGKSVSVGSSTYSLAGNYSDTLVALNGCDSVVQLGLSVLPNVLSLLKDTICAGESLQVGSSVYSSSGLFFDTLTAANGCDSVVNLDLLVLLNAQSNLNADICPGDTYRVGSSIYTSAGNYSDTLLAFNGCDSVVQLNLNLLSDVQTSLTPSICQGSSFVVGSSVYMAAGLYSDTFTAFNGCDSIVNTSLGVRPNAFTAISDTICPLGSSTVGSSVYTTAGLYRDTFASANVCDSVVELNLLVITEVRTFPSLSICTGDSFLFGGQVRLTSGFYTDTLAGSTGCDSIVSLNLNVSNSLLTLLNEDICQGDSFGMAGSFYSIQGQYRDTFTALAGCDSIVELNLQLNPVYQFSLSDTLCAGDSFRVGSSIYGQSGSFSDTLNSIDGCDSILQLSLLVHPSPLVQIFDTICPGQAVSVGSSVYGSAGNYSDTLLSLDGCDSIVQLFLSLFATSYQLDFDTICAGDSLLWRGQRLQAAGRYEDSLLNSNGCDSVLAIELYLRPEPLVVVFDTICSGDSSPLGAGWYFSPGNFSDTLLSSHSCDSFVQLDLSWFPNYNIGLTDTICQGDSFLFGGLFLQNTGSYSDTLATVDGCDSILNLFLQVSSTTGTSQITDVICPGDSLFFGGIWHNSAGIYRDTIPTLSGCDSILELDLSLVQLPLPSIETIDTSANGLTLSLGGRPTNADAYYWNFGDGQFSNATNPLHSYGGSGLYKISLVLGSNGCFSDTARVQIGLVASSIGPASAIPDLRILPNPNAGSFYLSGLEMLNGNADIYLHDLGGRLVHHSSIRPQKEGRQFNLRIAAGTYLLRIRTEEFDLRRLMQVE